MVKRGWMIWCGWNLLSVSKSQQNDKHNFDMFYFVFVITRRPNKMIDIWQRLFEMHCLESNLFHLIQISPQFIIHSLQPDVKWFNIVQLTTTRHNFGPVDIIRPQYVKTYFCERHVIDISMLIRYDKGTA